MDLQLADKVAIVTGASRGLGLAITRAFVAEGMRVVAAARSEAELTALAAEFPGRVHPFVVDMTDTARLPDLVGAATDTYGRLDVLVNNAGVAPAGAFVDTDLDVWRRTFEVNVFAPVVLTRAAGDVLVGQGHGKVINVGSLSSLRGKPVLTAYTSSKGALVRFTEALAGEWAKRNVQVNMIAPGGFATEAQRAVLDAPEVLSRRVRKIPAGRMGEADEIGPLACYLASPLSDFVTGASYVIDGGELAKL